MDIYQSSHRNHSFMIQPAMHPILDICKSIYSFHLTPTHSFIHNHAACLTPLHSEHLMILALEKGTLTVRPQSNVSIEVQDQPESWYVQAGELLFVHPDTELQFSYSEDGVLHIITCERYNLVQDCMNQISYQLCYQSLPKHGTILSRDTECLFARIHDMLQYVGQDTEQTHVLLHKLWQQIECSSEGSNDKYVTRSMHQIASYIRYASEQVLTRESVAAQTNLHPHYFSEVFKKEIGYTFSDYLAIWRINKAKEHLLCTDNTLHQIAEDIGYSDGIYLSKKFRSFTGMTPGAFRARKGTDRIASFPFVGTLLALGITPLATVFEINQHSKLLEAELSSVPIWHLDKGAYPLSTQWQLELPEFNVNDVQPDLIIIADCILEHPKLFEQLKSIAPLFIVERGVRSPIEELLYLGQILNRQHQAQEWVSQYHQQIEIARHQLELEQITQQTVGLYEVYGDDQVAIWGESTRAGYNLYRALKLNPPFPVRHDVLEAGGFKLISEHLLPQYAADHMFIVAPAYWLEDMESMMQQHPIWSQLPAVQNGQIYGLKLEEFGYDDGLALERQLRIQVNYLTN